VKAVATMDCPTSLAHVEASEASLFCASTLHRYGLPYEYAKLESCVLPKSCPCCNAPLWDPGLDATRANMIFIWKSHMGRCGGEWTPSPRPRSCQARYQTSSPMQSFTSWLRLPKGFRHHRTTSPPSRQVTPRRHLCYGKWDAQEGLCDGCSDHFCITTIVLISNL
jgi:hypothetical protein